MSEAGGRLQQSGGVRQQTGGVRQLRGTRARMAGTTGGMRSQARAGNKGTHSTSQVRHLWRLAKEIEQHPDLYMVHNKEAFTREQQENSWLLVSQAVGVSVDDCKKQWKSLRNGYVRHARQSQPGLKRRRKEWYFARHLNFLRDHVSHRAPKDQPLSPVPRSHAPPTMVPPRGVRGLPSMVPYPRQGGSARGGEGNQEEGWLWEERLKREDVEAAVSVVTPVSVGAEHFPTENAQADTCDSYTGEIQPPREISFPTQYTQESENEEDMAVSTAPPPPAATGAQAFYSSRPPGSSASSDRGPTSTGPPYTDARASRPNTRPLRPQEQHPLPDHRLTQASQQMQKRETVQSTGPRTGETPTGHDSMYSGMAHKEEETRLDPYAKVMDSSHAFLQSLLPDVRQLLPRNSRRFKAIVMDTLCRLLDNQDGEDTGPL